MTAIFRYQIAFWTVIIIKILKLNQPDYSCCRNERILLDLGCLPGGWGDATGRGGNQWAVLASGRQYNGRCKLRVRQVRTRTVKGPVKGCGWVNFKRFKLKLTNLPCTRAILFLVCTCILYTVLQGTPVPVQQRVRRVSFFLVLVFFFHLPSLLPIHARLSLRTHILPP